MKNGEVIELYETLKRISENRNIKFNVAAGYILAKDKELLRQEAALIYKMRQDIIMEHGVLDGKDIIVDKQYINEVNQKINDLMEIENEIQLKQIPIDLLANIQLSLEDMKQFSQIVQPFELTGSSILEEKKDG